MHPRNVPGPDHLHDRSGSQDFDNLSLIHPGAFLVPFGDQAHALPFHFSRAT
ncbi:MAG: hypothetical protein IID61_12195 [SAR324 cluster bacterium]|nr:hypothetical protein [SAR324 cluster bacterium]